MKLELAAQLFTINAADPDGTPRRTVEGIAVPYGVEASVSTGQRVVFEAGSLPTDGPAPKFIRDHDLGRPIGIVAERIDTPEAMLFTAKISNTREGDEALVLAADGVLDSVSVGVEPTDYEFDGPVMRVKAARWLELSLLPYGAFQAAKVSSVAAAADTDPETPTPTEETQVDNTDKVEAAPVVAAIPTSPLVAAQPRVEFKLPSASEYIAKFIAGGAEFAEFNARIRAAAPNVETTDTPGILPEPIVGPVYNNFRGLRPVVDAIGTKAMPGSGKIFRRPAVTTHTTIGASNGENAALDQGTFVVSDNPVTKGVYGGYVRLSEEDQEWTDPAVLGLLLDDMARIYANETDNVAADALVAGSSQTLAFPGASTDPTNWLTWLYDAAEDILVNSNGNLPTHLFMAPDNWKQLGKLEDGQGRPLFPQVGPMNAFGTVNPSVTNFTAFGLSVVVDRNFANGTLILGSPDGFEIFEQPKGAISVEAADGSLSRYIKFRGYFATLMLDATKFVKAS